MHFFFSFLQITINFLKFCYHRNFPELTVNMICHRVHALCVNDPPRPAEALRCLLFLFNIK